MKKTIKQLSIVDIMLASIFSMTGCSNPAGAAGSGGGAASSENGFSYKVNDGGTTVTITKYKGTGVDVSIPGVINNKSVTGIGDYAFYGYDSLVSVTIPASVTTIGDHAFSSCTSLASVTIPNSVTSIGLAAFMHCISLTSITIPASVTSIGSGAFGGTSLTSVTFQSTIPLSGVDANAFYGMGDLRDKFYAANSTNGTLGTYTRPENGYTWTKQS